MLEDNIVPCHEDCVTEVTSGDVVVSVVGVLWWTGVWIPAQWCTDSHTGSFQVTGERRDNFISWNATSGWRTSRHSHVDSPLVNVFTEFSINWGKYV